MATNPRKTNVATGGLTLAEVEDRRARFGWNELPQVKPPSLAMMFLRQFRSPLVLILIGAAMVAFLLDERIDAAAIGLVVLLNGLLGLLQEWRAEKALSALRAMLSQSALVLREGDQRVIPAREIVPDDIVFLAAGDRVPADALLTYGLELEVDESVLTGESLPVEKRLQDDANRLFAGSTVVSGRAEVCVTAIGAATEFGEIAKLTGSVGRHPTNLQIQLAGLARTLGIFALLVAAAISILGLSMGQDPADMFMTGLSLAVAVVPEGLPAVVTITLALGAAALVRRNALARRLQAVETLGAASVICTDKTGTLTENKMTATLIWTPERSYEVTGTGYDPAGHIATDGHRVRSADDALLARVLQTAITCTHARLSHESGQWRMTGAPTEGALVTLAYKGWVAVPAANSHLGEIPFSSERKRMSVLARGTDGAELHTKGAPEAILNVCSNVALPDGDVELDAHLQERIRAAYDDMASHGLRVIALAARPAEDDEIAEDQLTFLGLVGMIDPPRPEVRDAIAAARSAGIRIIMITGDSPVTARAIAEDLRLSVSRVVAGEALTAMSDQELLETLTEDILFARTRPADKLRVVKMLQALDQVVAMTGDGVNDAPALKQADIGVSMGVRGTDVAKDASDLVLLDDNFATIVNAVREGRRQFDNICKFVRYLLSSNAGEVFALVVNILIGGPLIFLATQILWMNLVTDGVTAVALGLEKSEPGQMRRPPLRKASPILGSTGFLQIAVLGLYTGGASLWIFYQLLPMGTDLARTAAFTAMVVFEKVSVFAFRSLRDPNWRIGWLSNPLLLLAFTVTLGMQAVAIYWPPLQVALHTVPLTGAEWQMILTFALPIILVPELLKTIAWFRRRARAQATNQPA